MTWTLSFHVLVYDNTNLSSFYYASIEHIYPCTCANKHSNKHNTHRCKLTHTHVYVYVWIGVRMYKSPWYISPFPLFLLISLSILNICVYIGKRKPRGAVASVLGCVIKVFKFELQTNTFWKVWNQFILSPNGLHNTTTVLLWKWLGH